jgi:hypothetical protein
VDRWVITLCNQHRVQPHHFQATSQGTRLLPDIFPRIIAWWDQHFHSANIARSLENCLAQWITILKSWASRLPEPLLDPSLLSSPGTDATPAPPNT